MAESFTEEEDAIFDAELRQSHMSPAGAKLLNHLQNSIGSKSKSNSLGQQKVTDHPREFTLEGNTQPSKMTPYDQVDRKATGQISRHQFTPEFPSQPGEVKDFDEDGFELKESHLFQLAARPDTHTELYLNNEEEEEVFLASSGRPNYNDDQVKQHNNDQTQTQKKIARTDSGKLLLPRLAIGSGSCENVNDENSKAAEPDPTRQEQNFPPI